MKAILTLILSLFPLVTFCQADETTPSSRAGEGSGLGVVGAGIRTHAWSVGIGSSNQLDTYLSPLNYKGYQLTVLRETLRLTHWADSCVSFQTLLQASFSDGRNPSHTAHSYGGHIGYDAAWHYNWTPVRNLRLMAGGMVGGDVGFLYNTRNGNDPAQGRCNIDISASCMAVYHFNIRKERLGIRYQINMPLMGAMFCPQFGQSYYEIGEGYTRHIVNFSHPGNAFSLWQQLTMDIPVGQRTTIRAGYLCDIRQSRVNGIKVHDWSNSFMIGLVTHFIKVKKQNRKNTIL